MINSVGKYIKLFLKNGLVAEGRLSEYNKRRATLKNEEGDCTLVVYDPEENIIMVKIFDLKDSDNDSNDVDDKIIEPEITLFVDDEFNEPDECADTLQERHMNNIKNLAELYKLKSEAEREQISNKLKTFQPGQMRTPSYVPPYSKK